MKNYNEWLEVYSTYLKEHEIKQEPYNLYDPINYFMAIGGKRFRPILLLMAHELYEEDYKFALPLAHALEIFHNFTLVHDDIMDEADKRRGEATVHKKYGIPTAILSGDVMLLHTYKILHYYKDLPSFSTIIDYYTNIGIDICSGQQWDMEFESDFEIAPESYVKMIKYKTAILLGASMKLGALIAGASDDDQIHLEQFAINLGIAFQIQDDVLDLYGDEALTGKKVGGDILRAKKTFLYVYMLQELKETEKEEFIKIYNSEGDTDKIDQVKDLFEKTNIRSIAKTEQDRYYDLAMTHLDSVSVDTSKKSKLLEVASNLIFRDF